MRPAPWRPSGADFTRSAELLIPDTCVVLIGHGSRDPVANDEFEAFAAAYRGTHPELRVVVGYVELARPLMAEALASVAEGSSRVVVVPVFLFAAGHVKSDLPLAVDAVHAHWASNPGVAAGLVESCVRRRARAGV